MSMKRSPQAELGTLVVHAGEDPAGFFGAMTVPIFRTAVFKLPDAAQAAAIHEGRQPGYFYGRMGNPTQAALEEAMCQLEGGEAALALASGMAAIGTTLLTLLKPGDHVVAPQSLYATTFELLDQLLTSIGIEVTFVDAANAESYQTALLPNTKVLYLESPANPTLTLTDIGRVVSIARENGLSTVMDNTFATPINQRPLSMGVDVVVHSATKYLAGHGDLTGGVLVGSSPIVQRARWQIAKVLGGVISPDAAWLVLRGLKTLAVRMERHNTNAELVAEFLAGHPKVRSVHYPGLQDHPQHDLARRQMQGFSGVVAFELAGLEEGRRLINAVKLCSLAVSLGDVATLIQHSASMTHASVPAEQRLRAGISDGLIRLSVGIERAEDIVDDLDTALQAV